MTNLVNDLHDLKADGKTRTQGKGFLMMNGVEGKEATKLLDQVWSRSSGADKSEIVAHIISCQDAGYSNAEIATSLNAKFGWAESTGKTVVSHLSYMMEYARQTK